MRAHFSRKSWLMRALAVVSLVAVGACDSEYGPAGPDQSRQQSVSPAVESPAGLVGDSHFLEISEKIPSFAGFYFNDAGELVVALTDPTEFDTAVEVIRPFFGHYPPENGFVVEEVEHSFRELAEHRTRLRQHAFRLGPVTSLGVKESTNRVTVGIDDLGAEGQVRGLLSSLDIPEDVVDIRRDHPAKPTSHLTLEERQPDGEVQGGWMIAPSGCTLGFPVLTHPDSTPGFVTNSHCTDVDWQDDGGNIGQPSIGFKIGEEADDPPLIYGSPCDDPNGCRHSDAAFIKATVSIQLGTIARTEYSAGGDGNHGSKTIDDTTPTIPITGRRNFNIENETLHKMGRTTGWTYGAVEDTCIDKQKDGTDEKMWCQDRVDNESDGGDSGSPVFRYFSGGHAELRGINWGSSVFGFDSYMSDLEQIEKDLGQLIVHDSKPEVQIVGRSQVPENVTTCEWTASVTGGTTPYSYQWKRDGQLGRQ